MPEAPASRFEWPEGLWLNKGSIVARMGEDRMLPADGILAPVIIVMKTTLDLPEALVHELERRAQQAGQDLTQAAAELLWKGMAASPLLPAAARRPTIRKHPTSGLPYVESAHAAAPEEEMTPERVAELLLEQEATWQHEAGR
jgi:hypothetical protein